MIAFKFSEEYTYPSPSTVFPVSNPVEAGDLVVIAFSAGDEVASLSDNQGNVYVSVPSSVLDAYLFYTFAKESGNITININGSLIIGHGACVFSGVDTYDTTGGNDFFFGFGPTYPEYRSVTLEPVLSHTKSESLIVMLWGPVDGDIHLPLISTSDFIARPPAIGIDRHFFTYAITSTTDPLTASFEYQSDKELLADVFGATAIAFNKTTKGVKIKGKAKLKGNLKIR